MQLAELPFLWGVLYAKPNPDGSRKNCVNCIMFATEDRRCQIHPAHLLVEADMVCGYHVYGKPMPKRMEHEDMDPVDPALSGLEEIEGGTTCDVCRYYKLSGDLEDKGLCYAVVDQDRHPKALVDAKGCCARWEVKEEE